MNVAGFALGLFLCGFFLHWLVWRIHMPRRQTATLLLIMFATLPVGLAAARWLPSLAFIGPLGMWACLQVAIFHVAMTLAYVVAYSALEERSPSMTLLVHVADAGSRGCSGEELSALLRNALPVEIRLSALVRDKMATCDDDRYYLTPKGRVWAGLFLFWLHLLKMEKGG
jgi:hypothetical protein